MARTSTQRWSVGDVLLIPQKDGKCAAAHVIDHVMKNVVGIALYEHRLDKSGVVLELAKLQPISVLLTTRELLDEGVWEVVGRQIVSLPAESRPYEEFRATGWVGAKVYGAGIVRQFLDAVFGLDPWDDWKDPNYLDGLLLNPGTRPAAVVYKT